MPDYFCRELLDSMQAGTMDPEVALLNASLVWTNFAESGLEAGISSLADAITCRIAARDAL